MSLKQIYVQTLKGTGAVKGSSGKVKLPRKKGAKVVSTNQYRQKKGVGY